MALLLASIGAPRRSCSVVTVMTRLALTCVIPRRFGFGDELAAALVGPAEACAWLKPVRACYRRAYLACEASDPPSLVPQCSAPSRAPDAIVWPVTVNRND